MSTKLVVGLVVGIALLIMGILYFASDSDSPVDVTATSTPIVNNNNDTKEASAPTVVTSTSVFPSDNAAMVTGTVNPKGAFTTYWYEYGTTSNLQSKTNNQTIGSGFVSIQAPIYIPNLTKNTTYYYKLVAENQYGKVSGSQYTFKTTDGGSVPVGSIPTSRTLSANNISSNGARMNGEVTPNRVVTQYWFEYGRTTALGSISAFSSAGDGTSKVPASVSLSDLEPNTTYYFRLNAQNQFGTINGTILNFRTEGSVPVAGVELAPTVITKNATSITTNKAKLNATVSPNNLQTKYWFEYSTDSLLGSVLIKTTNQVALSETSDSSVVWADLSNLSSNTTYYFRVVAENSKGVVRGDKLTFKTN